MYGVINGLYQCNNERVEQLNERISSRNIPSGALQPNFSMRSVSTKYALLPIVDRRAMSNVPIERHPTYNIGKTFNPGNSMSPWSGFASNVNDESTLRNQNFALQNCERSRYIPSSKSDMYSVNVDSGQHIIQPFQSLFKEETFDSFNPNDCNVGNDLWDNCTRQQTQISDCCNCDDKIQ